VTSEQPISWRWRHFDLFSAAEWHRILKLRAEVFVVEQDCPYCDPDHKDPLSFHLEAVVDGALAGTARAVPPGVSYAESSIGRVVIDPQHRGLQLGRQLMERAIAFNRAQWGGGIRISGQAYLQGFYESLGFATVSEAYMEDDIPHFEMLLPGA
jgi:ElaA protein